MHNVARHDGVRTKTHKLIHFYRTDEWELYDLVNDPQEMENLYGQPGAEALTAELKAELKAEPKTKPKAEPKTELMQLCRLAIFGSCALLALLLVTMRSKRLRERLSEREHNVDAKRALLS